MQILTKPLYLPESDFRLLFEKLGPSLGFWRAAEIAALREQHYDSPVLDLGCGDGLVTSFVLPRASIGLDPDRVAMERAPVGLYDRCIPLPMEEAEIEPGSLGAVISNSVIEHIPLIDQALAAVARSLRPGGSFIFTTPTEAFSRLLVLPTSGYAARRNRHFQHINLWPVEEWQRRLENLGLHIQIVRPLISPGLVRAWDALELTQMVRLGSVRLFGKAWRSLPPVWMDGMARRASQLDLSSCAPGGGRLVVAVKA